MMMIVEESSQRRSYETNAKMSLESSPVVQAERSNSVPCFYYRFLLVDGAFAARNARLERVYLWVRRTGT